MGEALKALAAETKEALNEQPAQPAGVGVDGNRVRLLTLIDSPFVRKGWDGEVEINEAAEAFYLLNCGPDALKPALDGRRAEFTVRALNYYEYHARGQTVFDVATAMVQIIDQAVAPVVEPGTRAPPSQNERERDGLIMQKLKDNPEAIAELKAAHKKQMENPDLKAAHEQHVKELKDG